MWAKWGLCFRSGRNQSLDYNRTRGKWQVRYLDGAMSQRFCLDVARDYAAIFGGVVEKATS